MSDSAPIQATTACILSDLPRGQSARVLRVEGEREEALRLRVMGLRVGSSFSLILGPDQRGAILASGGTRIALGRGWLQRIWVTPLNAHGERP